MESELKLFKVTYTSNNPQIKEHVEYLRHTDGEMLQKQMLDVVKFKTSELYGYTSVDVKEITINDFPEVKTFTIDEDKYRVKEDENTKLTSKEAESVVLNTFETNLEGKRYFVFDCNHGVLDKKFNEKLCKFFQDAILKHRSEDKK